MKNQKALSLKISSDLPVKLYFAYGANLHKGAMSRRCPDAVPVCAAKALDHKFVFKGVADIVELKGSTVNGALWMISEEDEQALDYFEGFPRLYEKKMIRVETDQHYGACNTLEVMAYVMTGPRERLIAAPSSSYYETIATGLRYFGYDDEAQDELRDAAADARDIEKDREDAIQAALDLESEAEESNFE